MIASEQQRAPQEPSSAAIAAIHKDGVKLNRWWRRRPSPWLITLPARATCQPGNRVPCLGDWGADIALGESCDGLTQRAGAPLTVLLVVARTWLSIRVDLVSGRGEDYWPRAWSDIRCGSLAQLRRACRCD